MDRRSRFRRGGNGDLKFTIAFRTVYAEVLARTVGTNPTPLVGAGPQSLGFLWPNHADAVAGDRQFLVGRDHQHGDR